MGPSVAHLQRRARVRTADLSSRVPGVAPRAHPNVEPVCVQRLSAAGQLAGRSLLLPPCALRTHGSTAGLCVAGRGAHGRRGARGPGSGQASLARRIRRPDRRTGVHAQLVCDRPPRPTGDLGRVCLPALGPLGRGPRDRAPPGDLVRGHRGQSGDGGLRRSSPALLDRIDRDRVLRNRAGSGEWRIDVARAWPRRSCRVRCRGSGRCVGGNAIAALGGVRTHQRAAPPHPGPGDDVRLSRHAPPVAGISLPIRSHGSGGPIYR